MNATVLTEDGEAFTRIHELTLYACTSCEKGGGLAGRPRLFTQGELTLATFEHSGELIPPPLSCSECGGSLATIGGAVVCVPDEPELPALVRIGHDDCDDWFLAPFVRPALDDLGVQAAALATLLHAPAKIVLDEISEETLLEQWGRPLSLRSYWLQRCALELPTMEQPQVIYDDGGLSIALVAERVSDDHEVDFSNLERQMNELTFAKHGVLSVSPTRTAWAAPLFEQLRTLPLLCGIDMAAVQLRLGSAITRFGIDWVKPPNGREADRAIWIGQGELAADIRDTDVAMAAVVKGTTLAEAAAGAVLRRAWELSQANLALGRIRGLLGPDRAATLEPFAIDNIGLDGHEHGFNLESILAKCWWNPASDEFADVVGRLLAPREAAAPLAEALCPCGAARPFLHLRPLDGPGHTHETIEDCQGETFTLISTMDCPHAIAHIPADAIAKEFGGDADAAFARGIRQTSLRVRARALRGFDNRVEAVVVSCDSVASLLAHEHVGAALARAFSGRLRSREIWAVALTTNLIVLLPRRADEEHPDTTWFDIAVRDALADPMVATLGYRLMFVAKLDATMKAAGSITIDWSEATTPVAA